MTRLPIGIAISRQTPSATIEAILQAERGGLPTVWSTVAGTAPDAVTTFAAAALRTERIRLGTSIVPAYPRHPVVLASQTLVLEDLAPGRIRIGIGPSHRPTIEGVFGIPMKSPLRYVREYITVMRDLLWQGRTDFEGEFFRVHAALPQGILPPRTPLLLSALRVNAFRQAGEIADGAISWVCPIPYLMHTALPALRSGAEEAGRSAPPLIAHVPVTIGEGDTRAVGREYLRRYARLPFYARMFEAAGYPVPGDGGVPDALLDGVVVSGTGPQVVERLQAILREGVDEVLVSVLPVADAHAEEGALIDALGASGG